MTTVLTNAGRRSVPVEQIRRQLHPEKDCGFYAIQNLYVWAGLEPPTIAAMHGLCREQYMTAPEHLGIRSADQLSLLYELRFPLVVAFGVMPPEQSARDCFPHFLDEGCALLFGYNYVYNGQEWGHSAVGESWTEEGVEVLCSGSPKWHGTIIEWNSDDDDDGGALDSRPHGCKNTVPFDTQPFGSWMSQGAGVLTGIRREFIIAWPTEGEN
jgi:hypothetical protein